MRNLMPQSWSFADSSSDEEDQQQTRSALHSAEDDLDGRHAVPIDKISAQKNVKKLQTETEKARKLFNKLAKDNNLARAAKQRRKKPKVVIDNNPENVHVEKHDMAAEGSTGDISAPGEDGTLTQQLAEMFPLVLAVIQGQALYFASWEWPIEFKAPFEIVFFLSFDWLWVRLDNITILIFQLVVCIACVILSWLFLSADEKMFAVADRRCRVAMRGFEDCMIILIRRMIQRVNFEKISQIVIEDEQIELWGRALVAKWKPLMRRDLEEVMKADFEKLLKDRFENAEMAEAEQGVDLNTATRGKSIHDQMENSITAYNQLIAELLGVLPKPPEDALEAYVLRYTLRYHVDIDIHGIGAVCSAIKSGVPLKTVFNANVGRQLDDHQLAELDRAMKELARELKEADDAPEGGRENSRQMTEEMASLYDKDEENSMNDGRDPTVEAVNEALGTDLPQPPLNGNAPLPKYEITLLRMSDGKEFVVCDDSATSEEDSLVRSANHILRHQELMVGYAIEELEVWDKKDYKRAQRVRKMKEDFENNCCLKIFSKCLTRFEPRRIKIFNATPFKDAQNGGLCKLRGSVDDGLHTFELQMNDECPLKCTEHNLTLIPAAEDRHYYIRTVEGRVPYTCAHERAFALKATRSGDWRKIFPCRNEELLVCSNDRCCFAVCTACATLDQKSTILVQLHGARYTLEHLKTSFAPLIVLIAMQSLLLPVTLNCLRMISCSRYFRCEFPLCYQTPASEPRFILAITFAFLLFIGFRIGLALFWFKTLSGRRRRLEDRVRRYPDLQEQRPWWNWFLSVDRSTLANLYRKYEFGFIAMDPIQSLLYQTGVAAAASFANPDSTLQMALVGTVEILNGLFLAISNPFIDPWLDTLAKLGNTHQLLQLAFHAFHRIEKHESTQNDLFPKLMIALATLYLALVLFILYKTVLQPWQRMMEVTRAAGIVRRERVFVDEPETERSIEHLRKLKVEKLHYYGEHHFQVLLTRANLIKRKEYLHSTQGVGKVTAADIDELLCCTCCGYGVDAAKVDNDETDDAWCVDMIAHLEQLVKKTNKDRGTATSKVTFDKQRLHELGETSKRHLVSCMRARQKEMCDVLVKLVLATRVDRSMKIAGGNAIELLIALDFEFRRLDFRGISIPFAIAEDVHFYECCFRDANFTGVSFQNSVFVRCDLRGWTHVSAKFDWKRQSMLPLKQLESPRSRDYLTDVDIAPGGKQAICCGADGSLLMWDIVTGNPRETTNYFRSKPLRACAFSPNGAIVACAGDEMIIELWQWDPKVAIQTNATSQSSLDPIGTLEGHSRSIYNVMFTADGKSVVSASLDGTVKIWNIELMMETQQFVHKSPQVSLALSPNDNLVACGGSDGSFTVWHIETSRVVLESNAAHQTVTTITFSPDGQHMATGGPRSLRLWDITDNDQWKTERLHIWRARSRDANVQCLAFSPDGTRLASGCDDDWLYFWDVVSRTALSRVRFSAGFAAVVFSDDSARLCTANADKLCVWATPHWQYRSPLFGRREPSAGVWLHPKKDLVIAGTRDGILDFYDLNTGVWMKNFECHETMVHQVMMTTDGKYIVSAERNPAGKRGAVSVRQEDGSDSWTIPYNANNVVHCALAPNNELLLTADGNTLSVYILAQKTPPATFMDLFVGAGEHITAVSYAYDSARILVGMSTGKLMMAAIVGNKFMDHRLLGQHPSGAIVAIECFHNHPKAVTAGEDDTIRVWCLTGHSNHQLCQLRAIAPLHSISLNWDDSLIAAGTTDGKLFIHQVYTVGSERGERGVEDIRRTFKYEFPEQAAVSVNFSTNEGYKNWLVTSGLAGIDLWDVDADTGVAGVTNHSEGSAKTIEELTGQKPTDEAIARSLNLDIGQSVWSSESPLLFRDCKAHHKPQYASEAEGVLKKEQVVFAPGRQHERQGTVFGGPNLFPSQSDPGKPFTFGDPEPPTVRSGGENGRGAFQDPSAVDDPPIRPSRTEDDDDGDAYFSETARQLRARQNRQRRFSTPFADLGGRNMQ